MIRAISDIRTRCCRADFLCASLNRAVNGGPEPAGRPSLMGGSVLAALPNLIAVACGFITRLASATAAHRSQTGSAHPGSNEDAPGCSRRSTGQSERLASRIESNAFRYTHSCLSDRHNLSMNTLSSHRPLPSMEIRMPAAFKACVQSRLVNWLPWSVLKISGARWRSRASCKASRQKSAS